MPSPKTFLSETADTRRGERLQDPTPGSLGADDDPLLAFASETAAQNQQRPTRPVATRVKSEGLPERVRAWAKVLGFSPRRTQDPTLRTAGARDDLLLFASETKPRNARNVRADEAVPQNQQPETRPAATGVTSEGLPEQEWPWAKVLGFLALAVGIVAIGLVGFQTVRPGLGLLATDGQPRRLKVTSQPDGLQVAVDGSVIGVTPVTLALTPGKHSVAVRFRGTQRVVPVIVTPNADISQHFDMTAANSSRR